jgi:hypothetical protein
VYVSGSDAAARDKRRLKNKLGAIKPGQAAQLRRASSGKDEIALRRSDGWLVTAASSVEARIIAHADLEASVGVTFDAVAALSSVAGASEGCRRTALARRDRARQQKEINNNARRVANIALKSRAQHEATALKRRLGITDEQFEQTLTFLKTPSQVTVMGTTVTATFNGAAVATRRLVLEKIMQPLQESAKAVAEWRAKKKPRKQGVPNTSRGLSGPEMLKEMDEISSRRAAEALAKESAAATRKVNSTENLKAEFESKLPNIVAKLNQADGDPTKLAIAPLLLLVRWLQQQHETTPTFHVKSNYARAELHPVIAEYFRVRMSPDDIAPLMEGLRSSYLERVDALSTAVDPDKEDDEEDDEEDDDFAPT